MQERQGGRWQEPRKWIVNEPPAPAWTIPAQQPFMGTTSYAKPVTGATSYTAAALSTTSGTG